MADYCCKKCNTIVPRGHRMQFCKCGKVWVDWGAGGKSSIVRVGWPDGDPNEWIEPVGMEPPEKAVGAPGQAEAPEAAE